MLSEGEDLDNPQNFSLGKSIEIWAQLGLNENVKNRCVLEPGPELGAVDHSV